MNAIILLFQIIFCLSSKVMIKYKYNIGIMKGCTQHYFFIIVSNQNLHYMSESMISLKVPKEGRTHNPMSLSLIIVSFSTQIKFSTFHLELIHVIILQNVFLIEFNSINYHFWTDVLFKCNHYASPQIQHTLIRILKW